MKIPQSPESLDPDVLGEAFLQNSRKAVFCSVYESNGGAVQFGINSYEMFPVSIRLVEKAIYESEVP